MAKRSKSQINEDEKKILRELEINSKEKTDKIASKLGFSRQKIMKIIKKLENNKKIWGYTAIVDDDNVDRKRFFILLKRLHKPAVKENIDNKLKRNLNESARKNAIQIEDCYYVHGAFDWLMCITAKDIGQVKRFCDSFNKMFNGTYISDIQILDTLFSIERNGFDNPNGEELKEFF
jgi:DNA-binding Lrp family transcriptional regulator